MTLAYQVFKGEEDKYGFQRYYLQATYFDRDQALEHCKQIVETDEFKNEDIEETVSFNGKHKSWGFTGWTHVSICELREIEIM
jgi:hypothetical protein